VKRRSKGGGEGGGEERDVPSLGQQLDGRGMQFDALCTSIVMAT